MRLIVLALLALFAWAADPPDAKPPPLPPEAQRVVDERDAAAGKAKQTYDTAMAKLNADAAKKMDAVIVKLTKAGDLKGALGAQKVNDAWKAQEDLLAGSKVTIISAKYGVEDRWVDATKFIKSKVRDGYLRMIVGDDVHAVLGDPAGGQVKSFVIVYTLNGGEKKTASFAKGETIELGSAPSNP